MTMLIETTETIGDRTVPIKVWSSPGRRRTTLVKGEPCLIDWPTIVFVAYPYYDALLLHAMIATDEFLANPSMDSRLHPAVTFHPHINGSVCLGQTQYAVSFDDVEQAFWHTSFNTSEPVHLGKPSPLELKSVNDIVQSLREREIDEIVIAIEFDDTRDHRRRRRVLRVVTIVAAVANICVSIALALSYLGR